VRLNPVNFPRAETEGYFETSPQSRFYNCIAWAAGDNTRPWWPNSQMAHWPKDVPSKVTVYAFLCLFRSLDYENCQNGSLEKGFEKVAIYALNNVVKHAAIQLSNGHWSSKIGIDNIDVEHVTLEALEGPQYGKVVRFLRRPIKKS